MKKITYALISLIIVFSLFYAFSGGESESAYKDRIAKLRIERVRFLKNASESPFSQYPAKADSLSFYPIDQSFSISANITSLEQKKYLTIRTNDGDKQKFLKYGYANFEIKGVLCKLLLLRPIGEKTILLAFADKTSGNETYGGGRYIDLEISQLKTIVIDFNQAYNPYCAYNPNFSCPLPPKDNILPVTIEAGEKNY